MSSSEFERGDIMVMNAQATEKQNLDQAKDKRTFNKGKLEVTQFRNANVGRATFEPGWKWSECVKPIAGTNSCMENHTGYVISGNMKVKMDSGEEMELRPHDAFTIPAGHDAWTVGSESCVVLDFTGLKDYAKPKA